VQKIAENRSPFLRLTAYSKIKTMLKRFETNSLTEIDCRLIKGVYERKIIDENDDAVEYGVRSDLLKRLQDSL